MLDHYLRAYAVRLHPTLARRAQFGGRKGRRAIIRLREIVRGLPDDVRIMCKASADAIDILEFSYVHQATSSFQDFQDLIEHCDAEMSKLLLGSQLTVGVDGSYAAAKVAMSVYEERLRR